MANAHLGPALSASARRRLTCGTSLRFVLEQEGRPVSFGRSRRTVGPVLRRAVEDRDRGCRAPGCTQVRWLEVHHLVHVEDGGETVPENLACLCGPHHAAHHRGELTIEGDPTPTACASVTAGATTCVPLPPSPPTACPLPRPTSSRPSTAISTPAG